MVLPAGLEPATSGLENRCSIQLSYSFLANCAILFRNSNFDKQTRLTITPKLCKKCVRDLAQSVLLLTATLLWTIVKIAKALKDFHGED